MSLFSSEQALPCFDEKRLTVHLQKAYKIEIIMRNWCVCARCLENNCRTD